MTRACAALGILLCCRSTLGPMRVDGWKRRPARTVGSACAISAVVARLALSVVLADMPPAFDEDRTELGFCSPDCPLQRDAAHSVAAAPSLASHGAVVASVRKTPEAAPVQAYPAVAASPDAPRAPPRA